MPAAPKASTAIELPPIALQTIDIPIIGTSSLIVHAWSEKVRKEMLDSHMKKAKKAREAKDPFADFCDSMYWLSKKPEKPKPADVEKARFGFPAIAFKSAAVDACTSIGTVTKTSMRQAFHVVGEMVEIISRGPQMREDMVRVNMGKPDVRFRGEFDPWGAVIQVQLNTGAISAEQVVNMLNLGGFAVGVGEWRPQRDGQNGRFRVAEKGEIEKLRK